MDIRGKFEAIFQAIDTKTFYFLIRDEQNKVIHYEKVKKFINIEQETTLAIQSIFAKDIDILDYTSLKYKLVMTFRLRERLCN